MISPAVAAVPSVLSDTGGTAIDGRSAAVVVVGALVALVCSVLIFFGRGHRRRVSLQQALAQDVQIGLAYLAAQIGDLPAAAGMAADDARQRAEAATALAAQGTSLPVLRAVRHTLLEGLAAAHTARLEAGLDPGAPPPPPSEAPMTPEPVAVTINTRTWVAQPAYTPGFVHHFPGGSLANTEVPGGWYAEAFWEPLLLGETERT